MANLIIDIGNTALKAAWADGITLGRTFRYQGERMKKFIISLTEKERPEIMVISSVRMRVIASSSIKVKIRFIILYFRNERCKDSVV